MRVLLDECLPRPLATEITGHEVRTVPEAGWAGKTNGELVALANEQFDVLVTIDQGIQYQQNLAGTSLAIIMLRARSNRLADLLPLLPALLSALPGIEPGQVLRVSA